MTLPPTELLLGLDLATMVVFWNAAAPKEGFACGCDLPVHRIGRGARGPYRKSAAGRHLAKVLGSSPGNSITKPPACYGL